MVLSALLLERHSVLPPLALTAQAPRQVCETKKEFNTAGVLRSDDKGANWQAHGFIHLDYPTHWIIEGCACPPHRK